MVVELVRSAAQALHNIKELLRSAEGPLLPGVFKTFEEKTLRVG
jgi:hypothetical protein